VELTTLETIETIDSSLLKMHLPPADPYPDKTPVEMLTREYLIVSTTLSSGATSIINPLTLLVDDNTLISRYLTPFRFLRCGQMLRFQFVTSPLQYGLIGISAIPYSPDNTSLISLQQQSQSNMVLVDLTEQTEVRYELPYLRPQLYYDILNTSDRQSWRVMVVVFHLNAVTTAAPSTITMDVFSNLIDPEVAGFLPVNTSATFQSRPILPTTQADLVHPNPWVRAMGYGKRIAKIAATVGSGAVGGKAAYDFATGDVPEIVEQVIGSNNTVGESVEQPAGPTGNMKLDLVGDISTTVAQTLTSCTRLGDAYNPIHHYLPTGFTPRTIGDIAMQPVFLQDTVLTTTSDSMIVTCNPLAPFSHALYMARMFKWFRGGCRILLKFCTSQMVSGRVRICLFNASTSSASTHVLGDVPTWIETVRGSFEFTLGIPYLQRTAWKDIVGTTYVEPLLRISLLDSLPQPFDKTVTIYVAAFIAAGPDIAFAGYQSCSPAYSDEGRRARFQMLNQKFTDIPMLGESDPFPYQGCLSSIDGLLTRFSSREILEDVTTYSFAFPLLVTSWADSYNKDNFDWINSLFMFYTGDTHIKMICTASPESQLIAVSLRNTRANSTGDTFRAGNGIALAHQSVWPVIEFTYPYMSDVEFGSVYTQPNMYQIELTPGAAISEYLIARGPNFTYFYLLPVPDFFLTSEPLPIPLESKDKSSQVREEKATFQSYGPNINQSTSWQGIMTLAASSNYVNQQLPLISTTYAAYIGTMVNVDIKFSFSEPLAATNIGIVYFGAAVTGTPGTGSDLPNIYCLAPTTNGYLNSTEISSFAHLSGIVPVVSAANSYVSFLCSTAPSGSITITWTATFSGFGRIVMPCSPSSLAQASSIFCQSYIPIQGVASGYPVNSLVTNTTSTPVPIQGSSGASVTVQGSFSGYPVSALITNTPSNGVPIQGSSGTIIPVLVDVDGTIAASIQGVADPTYPVWTTPYQSV
jgi:hypothetical protein